LTHTLIILIYASTAALALDGLTKKEEMETMIHKIEAMVVFVQDLAGCTAFYRDTFKLQYQGSDAHSASFLLEEGLYLILLSPEGAADLLGTQVNELSIAGGPRGLLAAGVADVDAAYEELKAKGVTFVRPPTDQRWGLRTAHFADPEGTLWEINHSIEAKPEG
jgi:catechol 2,3-dioxygenase-like lactoylglutathione lyase family enzyme